MLDGLGQLLEDSGVGVWSTSGGYADSDVAIVLTNPPPSPDRAVALIPYPVDDDPTLSDSTVGIQVRTRGTADPTVAADLDDDVFDALQNLAGTDVGGVRVTGVRRVSGVSLGEDKNGRYERTSNYYFRIWRPSPHRT